MNNRFAILFIGIGIAVSFYPIKAVSKVEFPKPLFRYQPESGFFIGEDMRICEIKGCESRYYAKGFCYKHWATQWHQENKERQNKQSRKYYLSHKKEIAKYHKKYRRDNKEHIAEVGKQYREDNKKRIVKRIKQWRENNKWHIVIQMKQYYQDNKEHYAIKAKQWGQTPKGKASQKAGKARRRTLEKDLTKETILRVYEANIKKYDVLTCCLCFKPIVNNDDSLDHSTPLTRKGTNDYDNLGIAHLSCNNQKYTMTLEEWFKKDRK